MLHLVKLQAKPITLPKVILFHVYFSRSLICTNGTIVREASHLLNEHTSSVK